MPPYNMPPLINRDEAGCFAATVVLMALIIIVNLAVLAASVWVVAWVLQQMGVL